MSKNEIKDALSEQLDKTQDIKCLLQAISNLDPGSPAGRLAEMAQRRLDEVVAGICEVEIHV